tara:strand:+ start:2208 stop:2573 length:366 start_codon:yes stop_codon:yes gene_type:complete
VEAKRAILKFFEHPFGGGVPKWTGGAIKVKDQANQEKTIAALQSLGADIEMDHNGNANWVSLGEDKNGEVDPNWTFTDEHRALLGQLPELGVLNISETGITSTEAKELEKALPKKCVVNRF